MKVQNMSEPISGTAAGVAGWKVIGDPVDMFGIDFACGMILKG